MARESERERKRVCVCACGRKEGKLGKGGRWRQLLVRGELWKNHKKKKKRFPAALLTSSTTSWSKCCWSSLVSLLDVTTSCFTTSSMTGFSTALVHLIQSLLGSNWVHIALMFSLRPVKSSGCVCRMSSVSLAVVALMAGSAAENVYEAADKR